MKKLFFIAILLMASTFTYAQKVLSHSSTIAKFGDDTIDLIENADGTKYYAPNITTSDLKSIGTKLVNVNRKSIYMKFATEEEMIRVFKYLYHLDKSEGNLIDLENLSHNTVYVGKKYIAISSPEDVESVVVTSWLFGKLLNSLGISVLKDDKKASSKDDMYNRSKPLF